MLQDTQIVGIDPGIVHTGVVSLRFLPKMREVYASHAVVQGTNVMDTWKVVDDWTHGRRCEVYIEGYRSRSNLAHDKDMLIAVSEMKKEMGPTAKVLDNTGVKKTVKPAVLQALGVWKFSTPTHHDDLRSAARIAVLGMLKEHNELLATVIRDHIDGNGWTIHA